MYTKIPTAGIDRKEWLRLRKTLGIGGSEAAAVCGLNPYINAMSVYIDKTSDEIEDEDSEAMRVGRDLEDYVAHRFTEETGIKVRRSNFIFQNKALPFMIADVDRLLVGHDAGLECKTANAYNADQWKDNSIPIHYYIQCQHYLGTTGKKEWYIAVLIMGIGFKYRRIERDEELIQNLIKLEEDFWYKHVVPRILPEPDGSKACDEILTQYFRSTNKSSILLTGFDEQLRRREELNQLIERMETEKKQIDQAIKLFMGENEIALNDAYRVSWSKVESERLDTKLLKEQRPDIYKEYLRTSSTRRFTVKAA